MNKEVDYVLCCKIYSPDGKYLGPCCESKFKWYLRKNLAVKIDDKSIKLNFVPEMGKRLHREFIMRKSICTICGSTDDLLQFGIIPHKFKKHFPFNKKSHVSNDIVMLCRPCSNDTNALQDFYTDELYKDFNISDTKSTKSNIKVIEKYLARNVDDVIAKKRLSKIINKQDFTEDDLREYVTSVNNNEKTIVEHFINQNKLDEFIENWKTLFVENMNPKYLNDDFFDIVDGW